MGFLAGLVTGSPTLEQEAQGPRMDLGKTVCLAFRSEIKVTSFVLLVELVAGRPMFEQEVQGPWTDLGMTVCWHSGAKQKSRLLFCSSNS